ncbi:hypothetical protein LX64_00004 [Chitinophaga skermanii]|uniref:DoxX family protein n=1 Tax=Chitinophaga skermanii TaxID=331697 RepID=A0A327R365_9BACT|nr:DoxX family protein [Chitinophaga skermanii]RAJ10402.1 hypothetical protein LX64_00004 [Chitinophaga skermanii]
MKTIIPTRVAVVIFGIILAIFGITHFKMGSTMSALVPLPGGVIWVYVTGVALILAAVSFIFDRKVRLSGYLFALFLLIVIFVVHVPLATTGDPMAITNILKDTGLMMGAIVIANTSDN